MTGSPAPTPGLTPYAVPPLLAALVPHGVMLAFVLSGGLDLAGFTTALGLEAAMASLLLVVGGGQVTDRLTWRAYLVGFPLLLALGGAVRVDWTTVTVLSLAGFLAASAATLGLRCRAAGQVSGVVTRTDYALRCGAALLALLMLLAGEQFVRLADAGWSPADAGVWSWAGSQVVRLGDLAGLTPEVALTTLMVVFFAFNDVVATALAELRRTSPGRAAERHR